MKRVKGFFTDKKGKTHPVTENVGRNIAQSVISANGRLNVSPEKKKKEKGGWRVGDSQVTKADRVITFEAEELGNEHVVEEAARKLGTKPFLKEVLDAITKKWGANAEAVWLCDKKSDAEHNYGFSGRLDETGKTKPDSAFKVILPRNAEVLCDLEDEGKLYVYQKEIKPHKF